MSLATRCPSCGTIFRVVQDQLRVSEGWVRCGQCQEVFHGIEALFDLDNDPALAARRAGARTAPMPPPARVFGTAPADPVADSDATATPLPAPAPMAPHDVTESSLASRPGLTGFAPTEPVPLAPLPPLTPPPQAPTRFTQPPVAVRGTIAPRFAARLAEDSARALGTAPPAVVPPPPPRPPPAPEPAPAPAPIADSPDLRDLTFEPESEPERELEPETVLVPLAAHATEPVPDHALDPVAHSFITGPAPAAAAEVLAQPEHEPKPAPTPALVSEPAANHGASAAHSVLAYHADADDDAQAGPPTLASMLPDQMGEWSPRRRARPAAKAKAQGTELALVDRSKDPRFLREARSGARWRRPWVRTLLGVAALLLVIAAAGQVAWPLRDRLAARWPATQPAWDWACAQAGCTISAPRALASLTLDGSSLTRTDAEHVLLFSADMHNHTEHPVAVPSFDVTFMDLNGAVVARKVLTPAQIGIRQAALPAEGDLHVHVRLQVGALPANGFQADLFYP